MDVFDIFWLICKIAVALIMFIAMCLGIWYLFGSFLPWRFKRAIQNERAIQNGRIESTCIESNREWLLSLDRLHLLMLTTEVNTGLDKHDKEDLVHIADGVYADKEKLIIVNRLAKRLSRQLNYRSAPKCKP
jgi:hypothetical protein